MNPVQSIHCIKASLKVTRIGFTTYSGGAGHKNVKAKLSLCLTKHHVMKTWGVEV
jgi:hypothetical protein